MKPYIPTRSELVNKLRYFYEDLTTRVSSKTPLSPYFLDYWRPDIMQAIDAYEREPELLQRIERLEVENRRLKAVAEAARKLNEVLNMWPNVTKYHPAACELNKALAALEEAKG